MITVGERERLVKKLAKRTRKALKRAVKDGVPSWLAGGLVARIGSDYQFRKGAQLPMAIPESLPGGAAIDPRDKARDPYDASGQSSDD